MLETNAISTSAGGGQDSRAERARRRALGIYYTPPEAAKILARWTIQHPDETLLEPSFGGCAMLSAAVDVYKSLGNSQPSKQLYGFDVDAAAFMHLAEMGINNLAGNFKKQDFLQSTSNDLRVDAVLANPPFVSYHRLDSRQREVTNRLRKKYLPDLPGRASLWAYFLLHSLSFLRPGGRMAYVLPNAVGTADYARPLMAFLQRRFAQVDLVHVSERLFIQSGADERISLLFLKGYAPEGMLKPAPLNIRDIVNISELTVATESVAKLSEKPTLLGIRKEATTVLANLNGSGVLCELGSVASVKIGEVVGNMQFFVRPLSEWSRQKVDRTFLFPLLTRSAQVRGCYLPNGESRGEASLVPYLLLPPEKGVHKSIRNYLAKYPESAIEENRTFARRSVWYRCSYDTNADAFIGSMSHDYPRIIGNDAQVSCSNAFYKIIIHDQPNLAAWLPILSLTTPLRLSAEILGRVRGSGGIKLEPSDVKKLCIPLKLPALVGAEFEALRQRIDKMLCDGELDAAGQLADSQIFLQSGMMDVQTMLKLRTMRMSLTSYRLNTPKRDAQ